MTCSNYSKVGWLYFFNWSWFSNQFKCSSMATKVSCYDRTQRTDTGQRIMVATLLNFIKLYLNTTAADMTAINTFHCYENHPQSHLHDQISYTFSKLHRSTQSFLSNPLHDVTLALIIQFLCCFLFLIIARLQIAIIFNRCWDRSPVLLVLCIHLYAYWSKINNSEMWWYNLHNLFSGHPSGCHWIRLLHTSLSNFDHI